MSQDYKSAIQAELELSHDKFDKDAGTAFNELFKVAEETAKKIQKEFDKLKLKVDTEDLKAIKDQLSVIRKGLGKEGSLNDTIGKALVNDFEKAGEKINIIEKKLNKLSDKKPSVGNISFEGLSKEIENALGKFEQLKDVVKSIKDLEATVGRAGKVATTEGIQKQWSDIEKTFSKVADTSGKINLSKQKKDIEGLILEYKQYVDLGGTSPLSSLTKDTKTVEKLTQMYKKLSETQSTTETNAAKTASAVQSEFNKVRINIDSKQIDDILNTLNQISEKLITSEGLDKQINKALNTLKEFKKETEDTGKILNASVSFEGMSTEIQKALNGFEKIKDVISSIKDLESTIGRATKTATTDDISKQWNGVEKKFSSIADSAGKINLSKQKKDIQDLILEYEKYINMGGKAPISSVTDNQETAQKLLKKYNDYTIQKEKQDKNEETPKLNQGFDPIAQQLNADKQLIESVKSSINELIALLRTKAETIKLDEIQARSSADKEIKSITAVQKAVASLKDELLNLSKDFDSAFNGTSTTIDKQAERFVEASKNINSIKESLDKTFSELKIDDDKTNNVSKALKSIQMFASKFESLSNAANALSKISKDLIEIDKCINVPDIFQSLNVKKNTGNYLSTIGDGLQNIKQKLDEISGDGGSFKFLGELGKVLEKSEELKDLATVVKGNIRQAQAQSRKPKQTEAERQSISQIINEFNGIQAGTNKTFERSNEYAEAKEAVEQLNNALDTGTHIESRQINKVKQLLSSFKELTNQGKTFVANVSKVDEAVDAINKRYQTQSSKILKSEDFSENKNGIMSAIYEVENLKGEVSKLQFLLNNGALTVSRYTKEIENADTDERNSKYTKDIGSINKKFEKRIAIADSSFEESEAYKNAKTAVDSLNEALKNSVEITKEDVLQAQELVQQYDRAAKLGNNFIGNYDVNNPNTAGDVFKEYISSKGAKISKEGSPIKNAANGVTELTHEVVTSEGKIEKWKATYLNGVVAMSNKTRMLKEDVSGISKLINEFKKKYKDITMYMTSILFNPYRIWGSIKEGANVVKELDTAFTEMRKVSNESADSLRAFQRESFNVARQTGETAKQIQDSTADWMRLGNPQPKLRIAPLCGNI